MNKKYTGLNTNKDVENLDEIIDCMYESSEGCGLSEIVNVICGKKFGVKYDNDDLEYVKEVMEEMRGIKVEFNLDNEEMYIVGEVDEDEE